MEGLIFHDNLNVAVNVSDFREKCVRSFFWTCRLFRVFDIARDIFWDFDVVWKFFVLFDVDMEILCAV